VFIYLQKLVKGLTANLVSQSKQIYLMPFVAGKLAMHGGIG